MPNKHNNQQFDWVFASPHGKGKQPATVEWELNRRMELKEEREAAHQLANLQATSHEREREPQSTWWSFFRIFRRYLPN